MKQWLLALPSPARELTGAVLGLFGMAFLASASGLLSWWIGNVSDIQSAVPRIERMAGYLEVDNRYEQTAVAVSEALSQLGMAADIDASQAGAQFQEVLRSYATEAGLSVSGSQVIQPRALSLDEDEEPPRYQPLVVELRMGGGAAELMLFLEQVYGHEPGLDVESLSLSTRRLTARQVRQLKRAGQSTQNSDVMTIQARIAVVKLLP